MRDALKGSTRYSEFRDALRVPTDVLSARLATLVEHGILEKRPYTEAGSRERYSYHLTEAGQGLLVVIAALVQWGDDYRPSPRDRASELREAGSGERVRLAYVRGDGAMTDDVELVPGPAATAEWRERYAARARAAASAAG